MLSQWALFLFLTYNFAIAKLLKNDGKFPTDFPFGASTSAYQTEGAWNEDGKGESIWDHHAHSNASLIPNGLSGDIACDSYHRYKEDIQRAAKLGLKMYRFSISWTRILPTGYDNVVNEKGILHYKQVVHEILKHDMIPVVTLYHWDLPQRLYEDGIHWTNPELAFHFTNYARIVIKHLPDVGYWLTINEPKQICRLGYGLGILAPTIKGNGELEYQCAYVSALVHATVYHMYKAEFPHYTAKMSISGDCQWIIPATDSVQDLQAAERQRQFECGLYYNPIFNGDWPEVVKRRIMKRSKAAGLSKSRLPEFTPEEIEYTRGTTDFLGVNHYYTTIVSNIEELHHLDPNLYVSDLRTNVSFDTIMPIGVYNMLMWMNEEYSPKEFLITELGVSDSITDLNDVVREDYYADYLCHILEAMHDGIKISGVMFWSFMDSLEWIFGYSVRYGLYYIDYNDPDLLRVPKRSAYFIHELLVSRQLLCQNPRRDWPLEPLRATIPQN
ncbi:myrosinase 1-like [Diorhabda sublineata]|uniref:myrosinase 1-like n=1 Tax=Diorhabda sublineata TaxID=1163346 RepID=UPI0024E0FD0F|nr:myrosinase 1-like [Diorhabda sublineata]